MSLIIERFNYSNTAAFKGAVSSGTSVWDPSSVTAGLSLDPATLYNGHKSLKYTGSAALGQAVLKHALMGGFNRLWSEVVFKVDGDLWSLFVSDPPAGVFPALFGCRVANLNGNHLATTGLLETYDPGVGPTRVRYTGSLDSIKKDGARFGSDNFTPGGWAGEKWQDWHTFRTLTERFWNDGEKVRIRGWLDGVLLIDWILNPDTDSMDFFRYWSILFDTTIYNAGDNFWIGEISLWDAEREPDPFEMVLLWVDNFAGVSPSFGGYEQVQNNQINVYSPGGISGPGFFTASADIAFFSKDLPRPVREISYHLYLRPFDFTNEFQILDGRESPASFDDTFNTNLPVFRLYVQTDRRLRFEFTQDQLTYISENQLDEPTAVDPISGNDVIEGLKHLYINIGLGFLGDGWILVKYKGQDFWFREGARTANNSTDRSQVNCFAIGKSDPAGPASSDYDMSDILVSEGVEFRLAEVPWHPPVFDRQLNGLFDLISGRISGTLWTTPSEQGASGTVNGQPNAAGWFDLWFMFGGEDDEDGGMIFTDNRFPPIGDGVFDLQDVPIPDCGGIIAAIVPYISARRAARIIDYGNQVIGAAVTDDVGTGSYSLLLQTREDNETKHPRFLGSRLRYDDPAHGQYAGGFGFYAHQPTYWSRNPATGEAFDPRKLPSLGIRAEDSWMWISFFGAHIVRVRPSNLGPVIPPEPASSQVEPRKATAWRVANLVPARKALDWRTNPNVEIWLRKNLAWRLTVGGAEKPGSVPLYCTDGKPLVALEDHFKNGRANGMIWRPTFGGVGAPDITLDDILAPDQVLIQVKTSSPVRTLSEIAFYSGGNYDLTGKSIEIKLTRLVPAFAGLWQFFHVDPFELRYSNAGYEIEDTTYGNGILASGAHTSVGPIWWRIRHDLPSNTFYFEYSTDHLAWTTLYSTNTLDNWFMAYAYIGIGLWNTSGVHNDMIGGFTDLLSDPVPHW